jgi:putative acetyltransferase
MTELAKFLTFDLRAPDPDDAGDLFEMSNLPRYRWGTSRLPFHSLAECKAYMERSQERLTRKIGAYIGPKMIGMASLTRYEGRRNHVAGLGIGIHDDPHGRGVGTALMAAIIDLADNWWNIPRIELDVYVDNEPAIRLYQRFGFVIEGTKRGSTFREGEYVDDYFMARWRKSPLTP